jgi:hypothetical protein
MCTEKWYVRTVAIVIRPNKAVQIPVLTVSSKRRWTIEAPLRAKQFSSANAHDRKGTGIYARFGSSCPTYYLAIGTPEEYAKPDGEQNVRC